MSDASQLYTSYDQVPYYRKQWFFWLTYFLLSPVALVILISGDVYYPKKGTIRAFGIPNRVLAGLFLAWILHGYYRYFFHR